MFATSSSARLSHPVWIEGKPSTNFPRVTESQAHYDVAVVGGGIFGVTTAYLLKQAGKKVALVEADKIGMGTTGSSTAKLTPHHNGIYTKLKGKYGSEIAKKYGEMQNEAIRELKHICEVNKIDCELKQAAHVVWTSEEKYVDVLREEAKECKTHGWPVEWIGGSPAELPPSLEAKAAVRWSDSYEFNPYLFCQGLATKVEGDGSAVFEHSRITDVSEPMAGPHTLTSEMRKFTADHVVLATHLPILDISCHFAFLPPSRSLCIVVRLTEPVLKDMYISFEPIHSLRVLGEDRKQLLVCGESVQQGTDTTQGYASLEAWARRHFPVEVVLTRWSAMDYMSGDHLPYVGLLHRGASALWTGTGFAKWGLSNGVAAAMIIRDGILGRENRYAEMVDARRWQLLKTGKAFVEENMKVIKHFIPDKLKALAAPNIRSLKPGEGGLVKAEGHGTVGAYLDEKGVYHVVKPVCTHMGCELLFNGGDRCWDCPCHGSRFTIDGEVMHGPACKGLTVLSW